MVARGEAPFRSANAGELSPDAAGRADIKQFYSAGLRFKDIEPVPLSGFRRMAGSFDNGPVRARLDVLVPTSSFNSPGPFAGVNEIYQALVVGNVAAIHVDSLSASTGAHTVQAQVMVNGAWINFGNPLSFGAVAQKKTFAIAPGSAQPATRVRLLANLSAVATVSVGAVTILAEGSTYDAPRYSSLKHDSGDRHFFSLQAGFLDVWRDDEFIGGVYLPGITADILPGVNFYAEGATLGIARNNLETIRIRRGDTVFDWVQDLWPYEGVPTADYGAIYTKTDDIWEVNVTWTGTPLATIEITVDGETTPGIPFVNASNVPVAIGSADAATTAANIKAALEALPSLGATVTVTIASLTSPSKMTITFGGNLSGVERQLSAIITNTATVAALASHMQIGETDFEPLLSSSRGWPGVFGFAQDRLLYGDLPIPPALSMSAAANYFNLNIDAAGSDAARLDKLRGGNVLERVLAFAESTYLLVMTDKAVYFAANRTLAADQPVNFARTASVGTVPNCMPIDLEGKIYYVGVNPNSNPPSGHQILSLSYSEIDTKFEAVPEHLLAGHLVDLVIRSCGQASTNKADASRAWFLRSDGRVVVASVIQSQEVLGFHEWVLPAGWLAREVHVDAANDVRIAIEFDGKPRHHRLDRATYFKGALLRTPDLSGVIDGLSIYEGKSVWARTAEGYVLGPFTVSGGRIDLGNSYSGEAQVGPWLPPVFESMPRFFITRQDEIIQRPGRIHSMGVAVIGTTSIAIGANSSNPENVPLWDVTDNVSLPPQAKTKTVRRIGIPGHVTGTTGVITQTFPGELHVRDITIGESL